MPGALTLRQAKAAHKKRGGQAVSEQEIRQLQREIQLNRRAWAAKEREKKQRATAATKRVEDQQRAKHIDAAGLATQRRCDKFGHKSSQFHLGAFFTRASELAKSGLAPTDEVMQKDRQLELYDDEIDGLDDEALLSVLHNLDGQSRATPGQSNVVEHGSSNVHAVRPGSKASLSTTVDWDDFLDSSTQIDRELESDKLETSEIDTALHLSPKASFESCCSLGLTSQDLEILDPTPLVPTLKTGTKTAGERENDRRMMPPPSMVPIQQSQSAKISAGPLAAVQHASMERTEFSLTQLETFVDDGMTLSQI